MKLDLDAALDERGVDLALTVESGETVAVLGPNGAGKSTLLDLVAGLVRPDRGRATLGDRALFDIARDRPHRWMPPHRRGVSLLAQDALLFPHLSAIDNVAFGPRSAGLSRRDADRVAAGWLERVDAAPLAERRAGRLSGGQAQRIAIARALAADPALLLLDEPMAALDASVAPALRRTLADVLAERTAIIVTHDVLDALVLADRVIVIEAGRIVDSGPTRELLDRPRTPFAAGLAGRNLLFGTCTDRGVRTAEGALIRVDTAAIGTGDRVGVSVRPSAVAVTAQHPPVLAPDDTVFEVDVIDLEPRGDLIRVRTERLAADIDPRRVAELDIVPGARVWVTFRAGDALVYPV